MTDISSPPLQNDDSLRNTINKIIETRVDANRRYIDEVLEKIQDDTHNYYLERLGYHMREMELAQEQRDLKSVAHHRVMSDTFASILQRCFP
jgi:hypothetical protein